MDIGSSTVLVVPAACGTASTAATCRPSLLLLDFDVQSGPIPDLLIAVGDDLMLLGLSAHDPLELCRADGLSKGLLLINDHIIPVGE